MAALAATVSAVSCRIPTLPTELSWLWNAGNPVRRRGPLSHGFGAPAVARVKSLRERRQELMRFRAHPEAHVCLPNPGAAVTRPRSVAPCRANELEPRNVTAHAILAFAQSRERNSLD